MAESANVEERNREARARRKAKARGWWLKKSRVRTTNIDNWGGYMIIDPYGNFVVRGPRWDMTLDQVEAFLEEE